MELDEIKCYEAMGLTPPEPEAGAETPGGEGSGGETVGDAASAEDQVRGAAGQPETDAEGDSSDAGDGGPEAGGDQKAGGLTPEQRRANAARRRRQEQQAAVDAAVQQARQEERERQKAEIKDILATVGLKNTKTGAPITTVEELNAWKAEFDAEKLQRDLSAGKLTAEGLNAAISQHPAVKQAQEIIRQEQQASQARTAAANQQRINEELAEIGRMDPGIKEIRDLLTMPNSKEFYDLVKKGYSYLDAYRVVNFDKLQQAAAAAAAQQTASNVRGKEHLTGPAASRGSGALNVPAEEMRIYRIMNPNATEAEIQDYYNKTKR